MNHDNATPMADRLSRRNALNLLVGAAAVGLAAKARAQAPAGAAANAGPPAGPPGGDVRATRIDASLQQLAPNVYAYIQKVIEGQSERSVANAGLIVGPTSMMAIDALAAPVQTQGFINAAKQAGGKPFKRVVITHHHFDHTLGLQYFGDVDVVAQEVCRELIVASDTTRPVKDLWAARAAWAKGDETFRKVVPNITYKDQMSFYDYGDSEVRLMHTGRGHTAGDTMVFLPKEKILFAGDEAFFGVTPMSASGYFAEWLQVCDLILALDVERIVPGHGPIGTKQQLAEMRGYLEHVYLQARKQFDAGVPAAEAAKKIDLGKYASWPEAELRTRLNTLRMYSEFDGTIKP